MNAKNTTLSAIKENVIDKIIGELVNMEYMSSTEKAAYKANLINDITSRTLATTVRTQTDLTDADAYNKTAYEIYLDILTTFDYINELYNALSKHQQLNQSIINTLYSQINALNDKLDEYESVIGTKGSPECFIDGFRTSNNQEVNTAYYKERYGEIVPKAVYARFNSNQESLTLNYTRQQNVIMYKSGVQLGKIEISKQYGAGLIKARNSESKLENAIDISSGTYWSETILCDAEMKIKGSGFEDAEVLKQYNRSFYDLPKGALCELCITFEAMTKLNELILTPFGNFPLDIVAIRYTQSDDEDDDCFDVVYPDNDARSWLKGRTINKEYAFHFPDIKCKKLYVLINQLHCIKDTYLISSNQMFKNELWFNVTNGNADDIKFNNSTVFAPLYLDRAADSPIWKYINNKMNTSKNIDINDLLINNNNKYLPVTKYQYTYGFYNIIPNYVEFQKTGVYVTKEIEASGCIKTVTIETDEEHYNSDDNGRIVTDIEYYIATKENPGYSDWHSICPKNKDYVYSELLQLDYSLCYLRHKAVCGNVVTTDKEGNQKTDMVRPIIRMNDIVLTENADYVLRTDSAGDVTAVEIANIDHFAIYTAEYMPTQDSKELNLIPDGDPIPSNSYEILVGDGSACYELNSFPYYSQTNPGSTTSYVKVVDTETGVILNQTTQANSPVQCVTDKQNPSGSFKNFTQTNMIQYYTNGKYIYFNQPIKKSQKVEVSYPSFDSKIRLKIIFRKNSKRDFWTTPVLNKYKLEFSTIN
jgi:hypothetical protein